MANKNVKQSKYFTMTKEIIEEVHHKPEMEAIVYESSGLSILKCFCMQLALVKLYYIFLFFSNHIVNKLIDNVIMD